MTPKDYDELRNFVHDTYEHIGKRPAMFAGRVEAIESFIFALEMVLDHFGGSDRKEKYRTFKSQSQFGNEPLIACFERLNQCRLGFVTKTEPAAMVLTEVFQKTFEEHWQNYLDSMQKGGTSGTASKT